MVIRQGDVFWADLGEPVGSEPGFVRLVVVIQNNLFNQSQISTVVVCALTSNLNYANFEGNVPLDQGEANLPKPSVVNVTQVYTLDRAQLVEQLGSLPPRWVGQILRGVLLVLEPREVD